MRRHNRTVRNLIILGILYLVFKGLKTFFSAVSRKQLWIEFFIISSLSVGINYYLFQHSSVETFLISLVTTVIFYFIYWLYLFKIRRLTRHSYAWLNPRFWRGLDPFAFENETADLFRALGFSASVTRERGDYGVDVLVNINGVKTAVQCKHYNGHAVTCSEVRDLWGARDFYNCDNAIMIGLDGATRSAKVVINKFRDRYKLVTLKDLIELSELALDKKSVRIF